MKILVTGCNGQLGYGLRELESYPSGWSWKFTNSNELNITNIENVNQVVKNFKPNWIINAAAYTNVVDAESNQIKAFSVNADGPYNLAMAALQNNSKLLHISTDYVFDGTKGKSYTELDEPNPLQIYGKSKYEGEKKIKQTEVPGVILRTSWLYGIHGNNFVKSILRLAENKNEIKVIDDQIGSPTYVNDLVEVIYDLLLNHKFSQMELLHFSNLGGISWYEFALKIIKINKINTRIIKINSSTLEDNNCKRPKYSNLCNDKIVSKYKIIQYNWETSLDLFFQNNKEKDLKIKIQKNINGKIARIGGYVNHYINYKKCKVIDFNLEDGGYGEVRPKKYLIDNILFYIKVFRKELMYLNHGSKIPRPLKTKIHDFHYNPEKINEKYFDCIISSNVIEHSPNPLLLILNFSKIVKEDGWHFHAIPNAKHSYDKFRKITCIEHLYEDFKRNTPLDDSSHISDYYKSAVIKDGYQKKLHEKYPLSYPYIHQHVFNINNVYEMFKLIFNKFYILFDTNENWNDILVLCKNKINDDFMSEYKSIYLK